MFLNGFLCLNSLHPPESIGVDMNVAPWASMFFQSFQQLKPVPDTNEIIHWDSDQKQGNFEHCQLNPVEILDESVNVLASEVESDPLEEAEGDGPEEMEEEFFAFLSLGDDLVFFDEVEHGDKGAAMYPYTEHFDHEASFLVTDNALGEEYSETPIPDNNNGLEGKSNQMEPGE